MAVTRIKNNQITDSTITGAKIANTTLTGGLFASSLTLNSNVSIVGNLSVTGTTSTVSSTNTFINDPLVVYNNGYTGDLSNYSIGMLVNRNLASLADYGSVNVAWAWDEAEGAFVAIATTDTGSGITSINNSGYGNVKLGNAEIVSKLTAGSLVATTFEATNLSATTLVATNFSSGNAQISGGYADGFTIGGNTAATGTFTTTNHDEVVATSGNAATWYATTLNSTAGNVTTLTSTTVNAGTATAATLNSTSGNITTLTSTTVNAGTTTSATLNSTSGNITTLTSTTVNAGTTTSATVNATTGNVTTLTAGSATISDLTDNRVVIAGTSGALEDDANFTFDGSELALTGLLRVTGNVTADNISIDGNNIGTPGGGDLTIQANGGVDNVIIKNSQLIEGAHAVSLDAITLDATSANLTTGVVDNLSSGNIQLTGGYVDNVHVGANVAATGTFTDLTSTGTTNLNELTLVTLNATNGNITTGVVDNFSSGNLQATGGFIDNIHVGANTAATGTFTTVDFTTATGTTVNAGTATAATLNSTSGNVTTLTSTTVNAGTTTSATLNSTSGNITTLTAPTINAGTTTSATVNATTGNVTTLTATNVINTTLVATNFSSGNVDINGGDIDGTAIGAASASTGAFTTLTASGNTTVTSSQSSGNASSGALVVTGGVGIGENLNVGGDVIITGDLTVQGDTTTLNTATLNVEDLNITIADGAVNSAAADGAGITVDGANATITYLSADDSWNFNKKVNFGELTMVTLNATNGNITTLSAPNFSSSNVQLTGGYADNVHIGANTAATGTFTTVDATTATVTTVNAGTTTSATLNATTGNITTLTAPTVNAGTTTSATLNATTGNITTLTAPTLNAGTGTIATLNTTTANVDTAVIDNVSSANVIFTGGYVDNVHVGANVAATGAFTTLDATTLTATTGNFGTATAAQLNGTNGNVTTLVATNFSSGNAQISGGYADGFTIGANTAATATFTTVTATTGDITTVNAGTGTIAALNATTANLETTVSDNLSSGNVVLTGGYVDNVHVGANVAATGAFTTLSASGTSTLAQVDATILNGATVNATAGNITTLTSPTIDAITTTSTTLNATTGNVTTLTAPTINGGTTTTATLNSTSGNITTLDSTTVNAVTGTITTVNTTTANVDTGVIDNLSSANVMLTGGDIDGVNIGASTAGTGAFTTLAASGVSTLAGNIVGTSGTASTSDITGALVLTGTGGAGIGGNINVGGGALLNIDQTANYDVKISGANDTSLLWARSATAYDAVLIGNSAVVSNLVNGAKLQINTTDSILLPVGTTAQRPGSVGGTDTTGMLRYNSSIDNLEFYDGSEWNTAGTTFTVIASETFDGDDSTTGFTLSEAQTTASCIVSINGVVQLPTTAYSVSGTTLTFTEAPATGDKIEVRKITTTQTISGLSSANSYVQVEAADDGVKFYAGASSATLRWTIDTGGNLIPAGNTTQNIGSPTAQIGDIYVSGGTIHLGVLQLKDNGDNTMGVYLSDGVTEATINVAAENAAAINLTATNSTDSTHYISFVEAATGTEEVRTDTGLTYNPSSGTLTSTTFVTGNQGDVRFSDADSSNFVAFQAPATVSSNVTWTLPDADASVSGYALVSDASGTLSWAAAGATISQDEATNTDFNLYFASTTSGALTAVKYDSGVHYNPSTGTLTSSVVDATTLKIGGTSVTSTATELNVLAGIPGTLTATELGYVDGVTSAIQTQLNAKAPLASPALTGTATAVNLTVSGDLTVNGTTTTVASTNTVVSDNLIELNNGATSNANDSGIIIERGSTGDNVFMGWDESVDRIKFATTTATGASTGDLTLTSANIEANYAHVTSTQSLYADLAENYQADANYSAGTVLEFGGAEEVTTATENSRRVAGIVSTDPAHLMNGGLKGSNVVPLALMGRVPCLAIGPVVKGDMMVSAGFGYAKADANPATGTVIGKALEALAHGEKATIEVVVGKV